MTVVASGRTAGVSVTSDCRAPAARLARLLDDDSMMVVPGPDDSGVLTAAGRISGFPVMAYCTDGARMGGALGTDGARQIVRIIDWAAHEKCPVIGLWHSGGARINDGVQSMDGVGRMFAAMTRASGVIPQISVVLGPAAGAAAYGPALTDIVIMSADAGRLFVTGPDVVQKVTGEQVDMQTLGGVDAHGQKSGVVHLPTASDAEAFSTARAVSRLFTMPGTFDPAGVPVDYGLGALLPESHRRAYDVRPLARAILDDHFYELQEKWARNMVIGLGRLAGATIGVIANNPLHKAGCLDSLSAEKAARFVRMCDAFGVPLIVLADVPGYLPGARQEWEGVVRRGAKLLHAFAEAVVPRVTLITRKSYGGAYIAMNSRSLGASAVFAWPQAEVAVMGSEAAVEILHRKALAAVTEGPARQKLLARLVEEHQRAAGGVARGIALGVVDEVIEPQQTRRRLAQALASCPPRRGRHGNIPL